MTTAIQFLRSNVPGLRPNPLTLSDGMPMINFHPNDPGLYFKANDATLLKIGPTHYSANPPNFNGPGFDQLCKGEMWLDTSAPDAQTPRAVLKVWSGAAWVAAGGAILQEEQPQARNTFLGGPLTGPDAVPTFRPLDNLDIPDDLDYHKFAGGDLEGGLLIGGGTPGWEVNRLTMGPGMTQSVGPNMITLEVTAGDIAADGQPGVNFDQGDGQVQLNYDGKFTGDARFKFINKYVPAEDKLIAHVSTELGLDPLTHTHIIKGGTTLHGDLTLTDVYSIDAGGDLTIGHNATIGASAADKLEVYGISSFYQDVTLENLSSMLIGGNLTVTNNTDLGTGDNNTHNITGAINLLGDTTIGRLCGDAVLIKGTTAFECDVTLQSDLTVEGDLTVLGNTDLGSSCTDFITIHGEQHNLCDILIGENVPAANAEMIKIEAATGDITTEGTVNIKTELVVSNPLTNNNFTVDAATGDATSVGTITAGYFVGDGSQLFNLAVPNAMLFHGDIDATSQSAPANPVAGDFYLNTVTGTVVAGWPDIGGTPIQQDQFIYFYDDGTPAGKWGKGSVQNQQGFVTINTNQNINGTKTFTVPQYFQDNVTIDGSTQLNDTLQVEGPTQINNTLTVASPYATDLGGTLTVAGHTQLNNTLTVADNKASILGGTLQVKGATQLDSTLTVTGHTQLNNTLTVADGKATVLGGDLNAKGDVTLGTDCFNSITLNGETSFKCGVEIGDSNNVCGTGNFLVYSPSYFYCPVEISNTLTVLGNYVTDLGGKLFVANDTQLNGKLTVADDKATFLGGTLTVRDTMATVLGGTLLVKDATLLDDTLTVTDATQLNDTLTVADNKATVLGGTLQVKKAATFNDTLQVDDTKASTLGGTLLVKEKTTLFATKNCAADALLVNGKSVFECDVRINANLAINNGNITGTGNLTLDGNVILGTNCTNTVLIKSTTTINCATEILNTLDVTGNYTTTLGGKLHVAGNTALGTTNASERLEVNGNIGIAREAGGYHFLEVVNGTRRAGIISNAGNELHFRTANQSTKMSIKADGKVGIGTTSPAHLLELSSALPRLRITDTSNTQDAAKSYLEFEGNNGRASIIFTAEKYLNFQNDRPGGHIRWRTEGSNEKMRLTNNGRLGIGITNPAVRLEISGQARSSTSTSFSDNDKTLVTLDYIKSTGGSGTGQFGYWTRTGTTLSMVNNTDAVTLGGTLSVASNFAINTNKFTVTASNGNTAIAGTLGVTGATTLSSTLAVAGNVSVNTNKFTITASNGNTAIAGTLTVTGATTLNNTLAVKNTSTIRHLRAEAHNTYDIGVDATRFRHFYLSQNAKIGGTLAVAGKVTFTNNAADALVITGKARSASTVAGDTGSTLVTKDYITSSSGSGTGQIGYWTRTGTTLSMVNGGDTVSLGGQLHIASTFKVNTDKFVVGGGTGNVSAAGTLTVTGATTLNSTLAVKGTSTIRHLRAEANNTYDIGVTGTRFRDLFLSRNASISGTLAVAGKVTFTNNAADALIITGKARSASTASTDNAATLVTKDFLDSSVAGINYTCVQTGGNNTDPNLRVTAGTSTRNVTVTGGTGITSTRNSNTQLTIANNSTLTCTQTGGNNTNPYISLGGTVNGTKNVQIVGGTGVSVTRNDNGKLTVANTFTSANNGKIQFNAGNGLESTGNNATANQSGDTLKTFKVKAANNSISVGASGISVNTANIGVNNVGINFNAGTGLSQTGNNATTNQSAATTKTFSINKAYFDGLYKPVGNADGQWEISGSNLRPISAGKNVTPRSDGNASLGTSSLRWANVYTQDMHFSNEGTEGNSIDGTTGNWTLQEGHDHLYFINNKTGMKFRVVMEQV